MAPVGLFGELRTNQRVRGVIAFSNAAASILKPDCSPHETITGTPPCNATMSGYDTQYGAGMMTSSPSLTVAARAL